MKHRITIDSYIWLTRKDFLKYSEIPPGTFTEMLKRKEIKRRKHIGISVYRFIPEDHFFGKRSSKEIIEEGHIRDHQIAEEKHRKPNNWGGLKEENIAWLMTYAHERHMTVTEVLDKMVLHTKSMVDLELWMSM